MNALFYVALAFALMIVKTSLLMPFPVLPQLFQPVLLVAVYLGLFRPGTSYGLLSVFLGYMLDLFSGSQTGFHMITIPVIYYFTSVLRGRFFLESRFFRAVYVAGMVLLHDLVATGVFALLTGSSQTALLFDGVVFRMLLNGLLCVPLFRAMREVETRWAPLSARKSSGIAVD